MKVALTFEFSWDERREINRLLGRSYRATPAELRLWMESTLRSTCESIVGDAERERKRAYAEFDELEEGYQ